MLHFSNPAINSAGINDIPTLVALLNSAYRGESSQQGWTHESHLISGEVRTTDTLVRDIIERPGSVMLKYTDDEKGLIGCVNLQQHDDRVYLGMLSVSPVLQGGGIGKQLLKAADEWSREMKCRSIYMSVVSVRTELIDWYKRHGYTDTGERLPFEEDDVHGKHMQHLEFMVMEKML